MTHNKTLETNMGSGKVNMLTKVMYVCIIVLHNMVTEDKDYIICMYNPHDAFHKKINKLYRGANNTSREFWKDITNKCRTIFAMI